MKTLIPNVLAYLFCLALVAGASFLLLKIHWFIEARLDGLAL